MVKTIYELSNSEIMEYIKIKEMGLDNYKLHIKEENDKINFKSEILILSIFLNVIFIILLVSLK